MYPCNLAGFISRHFFFPSPSHNQMQSLLLAPPQASFPLDDRALRAVFWGFFSRWGATLSASAAFVAVIRTSNAAAFVSLWQTAVYPRKYLGSICNTLPLIFPDDYAFRE